MSEKLREALQEIGAGGDWTRYTGTPDTLVLELREPMSQRAQAMLAQQWKDATAGTRLERSKVVILPEGVHLRPMSEAERFRLVEALLNKTDVVEWSVTVRETGETCGFRTFTPDGPPVATVRGARSVNPDACDWVAFIERAHRAGVISDTQRAELEGSRPDFNPSRLVAILCQRHEEPASYATTCTCETMTLMQSGCQCGAMQRGAE